MHPPLGIVVMGVSGSGKTTLSMRLGAALDCPVIEGDDLHAAASVAKMRSGQPLTDEDRWPWLDRVGAATGEGAAQSGVAVAACSALRRSYRERLATASSAPLVFVLLETAAPEIARRLAARPGHYMPATLLASQLATLERPTAGEGALVLDAALTIDVLLAKTLAWLTGQN